MANRYWIGNSGSWSDTSHWSTTSGGLGGASAPTLSDDVILDANSFSSNGSVTLSTDYSLAKSINTTALTKNVVLNKDISISTANLSVLGDIYLISALTVAAGINLIIVGTSLVTRLGSGGINLIIGTSSTIFTGSITPGVVTLGSNFTGSILARNGEFYTDGFSVNAQIQIRDTLTTLPIIFDITDSSITCNSWSILASAYTTFVSTNSTITLNGFIFSGGGYNYNNIVFSYSSGSVSINQSNTFNDFTVSNNSSLIFASGSTQTVSGSLVIGTNVTWVTSGGGANYHNIVKTSGTVSAIGIKLKGSRASGGANFFADATSTDNGYNTGWIFAPPAPVALFTATPTSGTRPLTVIFTDSSTNGATSWLWDFGDGGTSTLQNPTYTYTTVGTYSVKLTATNSSGSGVLTRPSYITTTIISYPRVASGTIVLGGTFDRTLETHREAKGTILIGGQANGFIRRDTDALEEKTILYKVYEEDGTYIEVWKDVITEPTFSQEINSTGSTMIIELARNSDSIGVDTGPLQTEAGATITTESGFPILISVDSRNQVGPGSSVNHNNRVDVYAFYGAVEPLLTEAGEEILTEAGDPILATIGAPNGLRIFTGFISDFSTRYGDTESTVVELSSYGWDLDQYPITNEDGDTKVVFNSYDPSDIAREAVDKFTEDANADGLSYEFYTMRSPTSISTTSTVVSYTFNNNTYADVLQKVVELMPSNWYYYIGLGDNTVYYRERSSQATHTFFLGKHIKSLDLRSSIGDSTNRVIFTGGEVTPGVALYNTYSETPASRTRRRLEQNSDGRVLLDSSADILSNGVIDSKNKVQYRSTIDILSKVYDIESINVGDMIGFRNFGNYVDTLLLQVVAKTYTPDVVTLQLDSITPSINKRLEDLKRQLKIQENLETPDAPS